MPDSPAAFAKNRHECSFTAWLAVGPAQLDFTVGGLKPISKGHSFHFAGAPYKYLYGGVPYKSPKIAENSRK
jgi:hypothetical protein